MTGPINWNCPCGVKFRIGAETTIRGYHRQPWLSHITVLCPHCNNAFTRFLNEDMIVQAITTMAEDDKCEVEFCDYAPDEVVTEFARQYEVPAITEHYQPKDERSQRRKEDDEHHILFLRYLLERGDTE